MKMKEKILFIAFLVFLGSNNLKSQSFNSGIFNVQGGLEIGGNYGLTQYNSQSPGKAITVDYGLPFKQDDNSTIGIGLYYASKSFTENKVYPMSENYYFNRVWNYNVFGLRGTYHYSFFDIKRLDTYVGAMINYNLVSFSYVDSYYDANPKAYGNPYPLSFNSSFRYTGFIGASYDIDRKSVV